MRKIRLILALSLFTILFCLGLSDRKVSADTFKYKDYSIGKYVKYIGISPKYTIDGQEIDMTGQPALLSERGIAYASVNALFRDGLGAKCTYNKSLKRIRIKYNGHILYMFIGSTEAYLDGEPIEAPCAPMRVKYKSSKKIATLVPTRFVAETLGLEYTWVEAESTVKMEIPLYIEIDGVESKYTGTKGKISFLGEYIDQKGTCSLIMSDNAMINADSELFDMAEIDYDYDKQSGIITLEYGENSIIYCLNSKITYVNGLLTRNPREPLIVRYPSLKKSYVYIPGRFTFESLGFYYYWNSEDGCSEIYYEEPKIEEDVPETDVDTETDIDTEQGSDTDTETGTEKDTETGTDSETNTDTETENNTDTNTDTDTETGTDTDTETEEETEKEILPLELFRVIDTVDGYKFFIDRDNCRQKLNMRFPMINDVKDIDIREDILGCMTELAIKGNYTDYFSEQEIINTGEAILQMQFYYDPNTDETLIRMFSDLVLGCSIESVADGEVTIVFDFVKNLYDKVIVLDAGHGGHDPGAQSNGYDEKDLNLKIILNCRELLKNTDVKAYFTRIDDTFITLYDRADFAELVGADMFIAVHHNSSYYTTVSGTSVYYGSKDTYTSLNGLTSEALGWKMLEAIMEGIGTVQFSTGVINQNFVVVRDSKAPAVLLEIGFMSNDDELSRLVTDDISKKVAECIVNTVLEIYEEAEE